MDEYADHSMLKVADALSRAFLAGEPSATEFRARGERALGRKWPWLSRLVRTLVDDFGDALQPRHHDEIVEAILAFPSFRAAFESDEGHPEIRGYFPFHNVMGLPPRALGNISVPALDTPGDLAEWLALAPTELDWFADVAGWGNRSATERLRHYRYRWLKKKGGGVRLLEIPKARLRAIQRKILREILDSVPAHEAAHGCVARRSAVTNAVVHAGSGLVMRLDLSDFFGSVSATRVHALFRTLGYPLQTARYLTGLTTHCTPPPVVRSVPISESTLLEQRLERKAWARRFAGRHLPQGAPTSAALANLCAYRLDLRLAGAAQTSQMTYTRYVDDLFFSAGTLPRDRARRFAQMAYNIIVEEGFEPNVRKTRLMPHARAQFVTGLVVNAHPNLPRREYDVLKAVLTNCVRCGVASENRDAHHDFRAHILGRISYVSCVNPARGAKLRVLFDAIRWE